MEGGELVRLLAQEAGGPVGTWIGGPRAFYLYTCLRSSTKTSFTVPPYVIGPEGGTFAYAGQDFPDGFYSRRHYPRGDLPDKPEIPRG